MESRVGTFAELLPDLQSVSSRLWTATAWQHAGRLAWSSVFADPDSPAAGWDDAAFGWLEAAEWLEIAAASPRRAAASSRS